MNNIFLLPGETLVSAIERSRWFSGNRSVRELYRLLLGRSKRPLECMPTGIVALSDAMPGHFPSPDELIKSNTLFRYWTAGATEQAARRVRKYMLYGGVGPIRPTQLPVLAGESPYSRYRCLQCDALFDHLYGCTGTLCVHQLPYCGVCPEHLCPLISATGAMSMRDACVHVPKSVVFEKHVEFVVRSVALSHSADQDSVMFSIQRKLSNLGILTDNGTVHMNMFWPLLNEFLRIPFIDLRLNHLVTDRELWMQSVRRVVCRRQSVHPVFLILLNWVLGDPLAPAIGPTKSRPRMPNSGEIQKALEIHGTLTATAAAMGVSVVTITSWARAHGCAISLRPKKLVEHVTTELIRLFHGGMTPALLATELNISISSVYRILKWHQVLPARRELIVKETEARKRKWCALVRANPDQSTTELRSMLPGTYQYLYRHAREWLAKTLPRRCVRGGARRTKLRNSELVEAATIAISATEAAQAHYMDSRLSAAKVSRMTLVSEYEMRETTSKIRAAVFAVVEDKPSFRQRRIKGAAEEMGVEGAFMERWDVARSAAVRFY